MLDPFIVPWRCVQADINGRMQTGLSISHSLIQRFCGKTVRLFEKKICGIDILTEKKTSNLEFKYSKVLKIFLMTVRKSPDYFLMVIS